MSVLCDVDVYRSQCICQVDVFVRLMCMSIFWLNAPMVAVWRVSGMWGSMVCVVEVGGM